MYFLCLIFFLGLAPLCENMPSGKASKPGDVVTAKNGKTIQVGGLLTVQQWTVSDGITLPKSLILLAYGAKVGAISVVTLS